MPFFCTHWALYCSTNPRTAFRNVADAAMDDRSLTCLNLSAVGLHEGVGRLDAPELDLLVKWSDRYGSRDPCKASPRAAPAEVEAYSLASPMEIG